MLDEEVGRILYISSEGSCRWWLYVRAQKFFFDDLICLS